MVIYQLILGAPHISPFLNSAGEPEDTPRAVGPESFEFIARFSDWLRLALLAKHGGVWLDATLLLTAPLQYLVNESANFSGVHLEDDLWDYPLVMSK
jgi:hypothetical protein